MRKKGNKGKLGRRGKCPKCGYRQNIKTKLKMVCCSNCQLKSKRRLWGI